MRNLRKRLLAGVGILGLVGASMVVGSPTAEAQTAGAGAVAFQGCTTSLDPVQTVGGTGNYTFATGSTCGSLNLGDICVGGGATSDQDAAVGADIQGLGAGECSISASGSYNNIVCGTGTTGGGPTAQTDDSTAVVEDAVTGDVLTLDTDYGILFVAGVGVLIGEPTSFNGQAVTAGVTGGVAHITPTSPEPPNEVPCVTAAVNSFVATGAAVATGIAT